MKSFVSLPLGGRVPDRAGEGLCLGHSERIANTLSPALPPGGREL
jgi:hypothetical protein